tara:strand:- start:272 stop:1021 length:750 start_codon:yes stop_codon:yes gene_type:complete
MAESQVYVVTGASKGLGRSICEILASKGFTVIGIARVSSELSKLENYLQNINSNSATFPCDLSKEAEINSVAELIVNNYPIIHGVIHNAGIIGPVGSMFEVDTNLWNETLQVNLLAVQQLTKLIHKSMVKAQRCRVTTISSGAAVNSLESWSAYCSSKAALEMWTKGLADEGAKYGISAVSVAPGIVDTDMQATIRSVPKEDFPMVERFIEFHNNGDLVAPDAVAESLYRLMTDHSMEDSGNRFDVREL